MTQCDAKAKQNKPNTTTHQVIGRALRDTSNTVLRHIHIAGGGATAGAIAADVNATAPKHFQRRGHKHIIRDCFRLWNVSWLGLLQCHL